MSPRWIKISPPLDGKLIDVWAVNHQKDNSRALALRQCLQHPFTNYPDRSIDFRIRNDTCLQRDIAANLKQNLEQVLFSLSFLCRADGKSSKKNKHSSFMGRSYRKFPINTNGAQ
jgi:hypothetical protein